MTKNKYGHDDIEYIIAEYKDFMKNGNLDNLDKKALIKTFIDTLEVIEKKLKEE